MAQSVQREIDAARFERLELARDEGFGEAREAFDDDGKARLGHQPPLNHCFDQATMLSKPASISGTARAEGRRCSGNARNAPAIRSGSPCVPSSGSGKVRERPRRSAAVA